jgi:hypothetical protein
MTKIKYYLFIALTLTVFSTSCETEAEKKREVIIKEATQVFSEAYAKIENQQLQDTLMKSFTKVLADSPELALQIAYQVRDWANSSANQKDLQIDQSEQPHDDTSNISPSDEAPIDDKQAYQKIKEFAKREYPDDYRMQQYTYNKQLSGYNYMKDVTDKEVKKIAEREYYDDYAMQKYTYDKQLGAKSYMYNVKDAEVKQIAEREYPSDYAMQKYTYDKQLVAKEYMKSVTNQSAKQQAINEYPNDYAMQKYVYDKLAY